MKRFALLALLAAIGGGCSYVGTYARQSYYRFQLRHAPSQRVAKHLLDQPTSFVFGRIEGELRADGPPLAVVAFSSDRVDHEVVDVSPPVRPGSYYGLNLPPGRHELAVVADVDGDGHYSAGEVLARRTLDLDPAAGCQVEGGFDLIVGRTAPGWPTPFRIAAKVRPEPTPSVFYPRGTIRPLEDPVFSPPMANLGLYQPAAFMEAAPMMFYALEDDLAHKVPVVFVHGIGGSAREFADIVARLDRRRYRPWFFHYPSGAELPALSGMFYEIFLSGAVIPRQEMPMVIVAHSMGGLVVREALNHCTGRRTEMQVGRLITIASPLGGHPAAARASRAPVVIPSWRSLDPAGRFVADLYRQPLPAGLMYHLFFALGPAGVEREAATDGVVPVVFQAPPGAQREAAEQLGFHTGHTRVLHDPAAVERIVRTIEQTKTTFPEDHLSWLDRGGYELPAGQREFTEMERYLVRMMGRYMDALVDGRIAPLTGYQQQFLEECRGQRSPEFPASRAWLKLDRLLPQRRTESAAAAQP